MKYLLGKWRLWWGFCPACNSDAPELDTCKICKSSRDFPPSELLKRNWWLRFIGKEPHRPFKFTNSNVCMTCRAPYEPDLDDLGYFKSTCEHFKEMRIQITI